MKPQMLQRTTETKLKRIVELSAKDPAIMFHRLMHHFNEASLAACFHELDGKKAVGADGITKEDYGQNLDANIQNLVERMKRMAYRPGPIRRVEIPKAGKYGSTRPLGIANIEDKVVQSMMRKILEAIYEPVFLPCSYGFRPGRGCHDAIRDLLDHIFREPVDTVIDVDLKDYFGSIRREVAAEFLSRKVRDTRLIRYVHRMFKSGVLQDGELRVSEEGTPQGSIVSPVIANVVAHYVIDEWFEDVVKKHCHSKVALFRYADDLCICCGNHDDALRIQHALKVRLAKFGLTMNQDKTKLVKFSKRKLEEGVKQEAFSFLGFVVYLGKSQRGHVIPKLKTDGKRMTSKLNALRAWIKANRSRFPLRELWPRFCSKLRGHANYYGITHNDKKVRAFYRQAIRIMFKWLNHRSQRRSFTWEQFNLFLEYNPLPKIEITSILPLNSPYRR